MRTRMFVLLLPSCFVVLAAWLVQGPRSVQADEIPERYRDTVRKGLEYLVKHQHKDGHWEGTDGKHPVAVTALAGLALLMDEGPLRGFTSEKTVRERKYSANLRKAVDWLIEKSQAKRDGLIFSEHESETARYMEGHGLATLLLAGVWEHENDSARGKKLRDVLTQAVKYIVNAQSSQGGWYHTSKAEGHDLDDLLATVIQIQALQAARERAFIPVPDAVIRDGREYLKMAMGKYGQNLTPEQKGRRAAGAAAALASRFDARRHVVQGAGHAPKKDELCAKWFEYCLPEISVGRDIQFGRDEFIHYYYAQAVFEIDDEKNWVSYRTAMFDHLQSSQNKDGSWPAPAASKEGLGVGPVHAAAVWCTILQLDRRSHPLMQGPDGIIVTTRWPEPGRQLRFAMKAVGEPEA